MRMAFGSFVSNDDFHRFFFIDLGCFLRCFRWYRCRFIVAWPLLLGFSGVFCQVEGQKMVLDLFFRGSYWCRWMMHHWNILPFGHRLVRVNMGYSMYLWLVCLEFLSWSLIVRLDTHGDIPI